MKKIEEKFNAYFEPWNIHLPPEHLAQQQRGKIVHAGWAIWYLFGKDEKGEYLDFYASHRMTDDRHVRIYANGEVDESLPRIQEYRAYSDKPEQNKCLKDVSRARNQVIAKQLEAKGFGLEGDEPMPIQMNRILRTKSGDED